MKVTPTALPEVLLIEPRVFGDARGYFFESYNAERYALVGVPGPFVQDSISCSSRGILRGLHFQHPRDQGKVVSALRGEVFDVAVDVRRNSPTFRRWVAERLSADNKRQLYIPPGFAHGFLVLSSEALLAYKLSDYYSPETERAIRWDDPAIGIAWPSTDVSLSDRDRRAPTLDALSPDWLPLRA